MKKTFLLFYLVSPFFVLAQSSRLANINSNNIFKTDYFIENHGQFDYQIPNGKDIKYAVHNGGDEFYVTRSGISFHLTELNLKPAFDGLDQKELKEMKEQTSVYDRVSDFISLKWIGSDLQAKIQTDGKSSHYFTYGSAKYNSQGYKKITSVNLYDKINVEYEIHPNGGLEYTLVLAPGADLSQIQFTYQGAKKIRLSADKKSLEIENKIRTLHETAIKAYYENGEEVNLFYSLNNNRIAFSSSQPIDKNRTLIIDPWVTTNTSLVGSVGATGGENKAYDVDFDLQGNMYVIGGGGMLSTTPNAYPKIAKYNAAGALQWTFSGVIVAPAWNSSPGTTSFSRVGNLVVDKKSSKTYMSQGLAVSAGAQMIRLDPLGNYDNFITVSNANFKEIWEMKFNCSTGEVMGIGGGTSSNINFGLVDTTTGNVNNSNITGVAGAGQDIACATIGLANDVYCLFASGGTQVANKIYKVNATYNGNIWNVASGYTTFTEQGNKPFVNTSAFSNGHNCLSSNNNYVFYYDGINIKCFDNTNGAAVGTSFALTGYVAKMQGGIYSNDCNEVYVGGNDGNIIKFQFNGSTFTPTDTLSIPGNGGKAVYDIVFNAFLNELYVSGDQFVATVNPLSSCILSSGGIQIKVDTLCPDSAVVTILNPDPFASYTFSWYDSTTNQYIQNTQQAVGVFMDTVTGLISGNLYSVHVLKSVACQVVSGTAVFSIVCNATVGKCPNDYYLLSNNDTVFSPGVYYDSLLSIYVTVFDYPSYQFILYDTICQGKSYGLPGGTLVTTAGTYIDPFLTQHGCDSTYTVHLFVKPSSSSSQSATICGNETYTLPDNLVVGTSGTYVSVLVNSIGCDSLITTTLTVNPVFSETQNATICQDDSYTLPSGVVVSTAGTYTDKFKTWQQCDSIIITELAVVPKPTVELGGNAELCLGRTVTLNAQQTFNSSYLWSDGSTDPTLTVDQIGTYWVTISRPPCSPASDTVRVDLVDCDCFVAVPNAFSPNGDNLNDCFKIIKFGNFNKYEIYIYNRWGMPVYESEDPNACWDGNYRGFPAPIGTYYYYIKADGECGPYLKKGDINLVK